MQRPLSARQLDRYFTRIGYRGPRDATLGTLRALHRAHLLAIRYENLDIHLGVPITLEPDAMFTKLVDERRGGWCYEMNGTRRPVSMPDKIIGTGITFDDVLLVPARSAFLPADTDVSTRLTRKIRLNIPIVSAAMDTVTEAPFAIAIARAGGLGFIHKNMSPERQAEHVDMVKRSEAGVISNPLTLGPGAL